LRALDPGELDQWPNERNPIFFMSAPTYADASIIPLDAAVSARCGGCAAHIAPKPQYSRVSAAHVAVHHRLVGGVAGDEGLQHPGGGRELAVARLPVLALDGRSEGHTSE